MLDKVLFVILSLLPALGFHKPRDIGLRISQAVTLIYNPFFELLAVVFPCVGMWFIYGAGKSVRGLSETS